MSAPGGTSVLLPLGGACGTTPLLSSFPSNALPGAVMHGLVILLQEDVKEYLLTSWDFIFV